jgi:hypothetical protein
MGNRRWLKIECLPTVNDPESKRLKVAALNLWEASRLSFDRPLPGKPPNIPDRLSPFPKSLIFILPHSLSMGGRDMLHPSLRLEVKPTETIKQDCKGTCFYI